MAPTARARIGLSIATVVAIATSFAMSSLPAPGQTIEGTVSLSVRQVTRGAIGGPFAFELTDGAEAPLVQQGVATTSAESDTVDVAGLGGELPPGTYTLRQDLAELPAEPSGGRWEFTGVECDGAAVTIDVPSATATITLDPGATATCIATDTWVADAPSDDQASAAAVPPVDPDDVVVPLASPTTATIRVFKSGLRTGPSAEAPLAGATFAVYGTEANAINGVSPLATCVTVANGTCTMDVPVVAPATSRDVWVREATAPAGYFRLNTISTGTASATSDNTTSRPYMEKVTIRNNQTFNLPPDQPLNGGGNEARSFANALNNPQAAPQCGLNVAMVFDVSSSINSSEMTSMKNAARTFVTDLTGTPSQIAMFSFGTVAPGAGAPANLPLTQVATGNVPVMSYINGLPANPSSGSNRTNWDAGLFQVAQSTSNFDIALMLTDGNPTVWGPTGVRAPDVSGGAAVVAAGIEEAVASANAVKNEGTQILAIGIGPTNLPVDNLRAISGDGDFFTTGFDTLGDLLQELATALCQGTVTVVKETRAAGQALFTPAGGWTFNSTTSTVSPTSGTTAAVTGAVNFTVDFSASQTPQTVSFEEVLKPGWNLVPQDGLNARCTTQGLTAVRASPNLGPTGFTVNVGPSDIVSCLVRNEQPNLPRLTLVKQVVNDNGGAAVPTAWTLNAAGPTPLSGPTGSTAVTNQIVGAGTYNLSETGGPPPGTYTAGPWSCTGATSFTASSVTLDADDVATCTIINNDIPARLTLVKTVVNNFGGTALPTAWTLNADGPTDISGVTGSAAVTNAAVNAGDYNVFESNGPAGYTSGAWSCSSSLRTLFRTAEQLTLSLGESAICTLTNFDVAAQLTLVKQVTNNNGGTAAPSAWTLRADGQEIVEGTTGTPDVTNVIVPIGTYGLSETGPPGYAASDWVCTGATQSTATSVTLGIGQSATCTITNDDIPAQLTLSKGVVNDNGGTAEADDWTLNAAGPTTGINGATGTAPVTGVQVLPGTYALSESGPGPPGYAASDWSCTGAAVSTETSVTVALGETVVCAIVNDDQPAELTLVKVVTNDDGGTALDTDWTLTATGAGGAGISGPTGSGSVTNVGVPPGSYALSETGPAGYTASAWSCVGGTQTGASIAVALGESATCTITNDDLPAQLTLVKVVVNDDGGTALPSAWTLSAAGPTPISGATGTAPVTAAAVDAGTYALSETGPAGYTASAWSCVGGTQTGASIAVASGQAATCTITNDDAPAQLTLVKVVTNDDGGTALPSAWTLSAAGPTPISGATGTAPVTAAAVDAGTYALSESGPVGYSASPWVCSGGTQTGASIALALGQAATCTITNDDIPAQLTLVKMVTNDNGGTAQPSEWTLNAAGPTPLSGTTGVSAAVNTGTYDLSESGPAGYAASAWVCVGGTQTDDDSVALALGQAATCTITNDDIPAQLTLVKLVTNDNGGTALPTAWTLSAAGPTPVSGTTGVSAAVNAGTYDLSESGPAGYAASAWVCVGGTQTDDDSVALALGQAATCTITNDDIPAQLTLVKVVVNDNGGTALPTAWTLTGTGTTQAISGPTGDPLVTNASVDAGTYALSETGPAGYAASAWVCTGDGTQTGASVALALGQAAECTITNDDIPAQLTLVKVVTNDDGGTALPTAWTLSAAGPTPVSGTTGVSAAVNAGSYDLTESGPAGYAASAWVCVGGTQADGDSVALALGESATCTITNDDIPAQLTLVKVVTNDDGGTALPTAWTLTGTGTTQTISGPTGDPLVTNASVDAGTYALSETGPAGYAASPWVCVGGTQTGASIALALGESAECTITNDDQPAQLTLVKVVTNDHGGTAGPEDWTLTATGPRQTISGATGDPAVTNAEVLPDTYEVTERGPAEYVSSLFVCIGGTQSGPMITLALGESATCTVTNDDIEAEITLDKTSSATMITPGSQVPYAFTVTNVSQATAENVVLTDPLPAGLTFVSSPDGCTAANPQNVTCNIGSLAPGEVATRNIVTLAANPFPSASVDPGGLVPNTATVTSPNTNCPPAGRAIRTTPAAFGPLQATEEDCESTHPLPVLPTIAITKTSVSTSLSPGGLVPYVITVTNTGPVVARNVVVTDDLPMGLSFVSSAPPCTASGQLVTCPLGDLERGATANIDLVTRAADPFPTESLINGEIVNVAIVSGTDTNCSNGSSDPVCSDIWALRPDDPAIAAAAEESDSLPFTGAAILWLLATAVCAIAAGVLLLCVPRIPAAGRRARLARMRDALRSRLDPTS